MKTLKVSGGDVELGYDGYLTYIEGYDKTLQDVAEMITSDSNIGAGLENLIGTVGDETSLRILIDQKIRTAISNLIYLQGKETRPSNEKLYSQYKLQVSAVNPTSFILVLDLKTQANSSLTGTFQL